MGYKKATNTHTLLKKLGNLKSNHMLITAAKGKPHLFYNKCGFLLN
jgi:hypothetical protein